MSGATERSLSHFATEDARPATFLERGVTVPFTTPMLLGARARPAERRGLEFAIANPAGVRGSYIVPLASLTEICTPTLHDRMLCEAIASTPAITPDRMLRIARDVARRGLAGRETASAAAAADRADMDQRLVTNFRLLLHLVEQTELPGEHTIPASRDTPASVEQRARRAIARTAPRLHLHTETIVNGLESLAGAYVPVGFRGDPTRARYQCQLADLEMLAASVSAWAAAAVDGQEASSASLIARSAELTLNCARPIMKELIDALDNIGRLLLRWSEDSTQLLGLIARPAWLLDGWTVLIGIWRNESEAGRAAAIREMSVLVPTMPVEADSWMGGSQERFEMVHRARGRFVFRLQEWRTGNAIKLIQRNEKLVREAV
jgi:hypothetical protein